MLIPTVIETTNRGEQAYDIYSRLLRERIVFLGSALDETVANLIIAQLLHLEGEDMDRPVNLYINSPGGDMTALFAVYDAMQFMGPPVHTVCVGQACSAAAVLLAAGAEGTAPPCPTPASSSTSPTAAHRASRPTWRSPCARWSSCASAWSTSSPSAPASLRAHRGRHRPRLHPARRGGGRVRVGRRGDRPPPAATRRRASPAPASPPSRRTPPWADGYPAPASPAPVPPVPTSDHDGASSPGSPGAWAGSTSPWRVSITSAHPARPGRPRWPSPGRSPR